MNAPVTREFLQLRIEQMERELEAAAQNERAAFTECARAHEICQHARHRWDVTHERDDYEAWQQAEAELVRTRNAHSDARSKRTDLKMLLEVMRCKLARIDASAQL